MAGTRGVKHPTPGAPKARKVDPTPDPIPEVPTAAKKGGKAAKKKATPDAETTTATTKKAPAPAKKVHPVAALNVLDEDECPQDVENFACWVGDHRPLWHPEDAKKKDIKYKQAAWLYAGKFKLKLKGFPDNEIIEMTSKKWRNMRTAYMRAKRMAGKSGAGSDEPLKNQYWLAEQMSFLEEVPQYRRSVQKLPFIHINRDKIGTQSLPGRDSYFVA